MTQAEHNETIPKTVRNPMVSELEKEYMEWARAHRDLVYGPHAESVQEGFEYFFETKQHLLPKGGHRPPFKGRGIPRYAIPSFMLIFRSIMKGMKQSWKDVMPYLSNPERTAFSPRPELWDELVEYVRSRWDDVILGFTELPSQMIFRNKFTLFKYAIVVGQEMKKEKIDKAPTYIAGKEVWRVYGSLGHVVNDIARWLRRKDVRCQSNHPVGGLTNTSSLAGKAGMGWQGKHGLLITPEFGPRLRLAPVFVEHKYFEFTDNRDHDWIEEYCELCRRCQKKCPTQAIYDTKQVRMKDVPGIEEFRTCIDRDRCFDYFFKTMGCSVCVKVCPFSRAGDTYSKLKAIVEKRRAKVSS